MVQVLRRILLPMNIMKVEIEVVETEGNCLAVWLWTLVTWEPLRETGETNPSSDKQNGILSTLSARCSCCMWLTRFLFSLALYLQWLLALANVPAHCQTPSFSMCFIPLAM